MYTILDFCQALAGSISYGMVDFHISSQPPALLFVFKHFFSATHSFIYHYNMRCFQPFEVNVITVMKKLWKYLFYSSLVSPLHGLWVLETLTLRPAHQYRAVISTSSINWPPLSHQTMKMLAPSLLLLICGLAGARVGPVEPEGHKEVNF